MQFSKTSTPGRFLTHVVPAVLKPLRVLWNEMIGFLFLVMAVIAAPSIWRNFQEFGRGEGSFFKFALPLALALLLVYFGLSSFFRARKISKS